GLEREVVEGTLVGIVGIARQSVIDGEIGKRFCVSAFGGSTGRILRRAAQGECEAAIVGRAPARENGVVALAEGEAIEPCGRRDNRCGKLPPESRSAVGILEHETRHTEQRLAEKRTANAARNLIVPRRWGRFARNLPRRAAGEGIRERFPVV